MRRRWGIARRAVQVAALALFATPLLLSGWALFGLSAKGEAPVPTPADLPFYGSLSASSLAGFSLYDPFAVLELVVASRTLEPAWLVGGGIVLGFYACVGARAFCGWVCPVNLLLEGVGWLRTRLGLPVAGRALPRRTKLAVAGAFLLLAAFAARPLFEGVSPIAALNRGMLFGSLAGTLTLVALVLTEFFCGHRVWCRSLCPVGALYEAAGRLGPLKVRIDPAACTQCQRCKEACLAEPEILDPVIEGRSGHVRAGDCMRCGACVDACPHGALRIAVPRRGRQG
ncbi:MAG: 4Fe-4S binding protein [Coriobacteriales bacterium]|jgi:ferredoxin-type protein NapH|nr:4Fe-4S binding protein [Coriobacteriales bacterium]